MCFQVSELILVVLKASVATSLFCFLNPLNSMWSVACFELPPLILNDLNDQQQNLYQWHGQIIMLNFWATWCGPCQIEIPDFIDLQVQYADQGLQIIGVGLDEPGKLRNYVRTASLAMADG
jgi:thiol-disulfide isomerase/thioredoxin